MKTLIVLFSLTLCGLGCSKHPAEKDETWPSITLNSPVHGQVYNAGDVIAITGIIADNKFVAEGHIHVSNKGTGALLMDVHLTPGSPTVNFNHFIVASAGITYTIDIIAKDRSLNQTSTSVEVSCN